MFSIAFSAKNLHSVHGSVIDMCLQITEGVGLNRLTANFQAASIDEAVQCSDQEAVDMAQFLLHNEGLYVGSSSAVNCVGAVKLARLAKLGRGQTVVTVLCDR